MRESLRGTFLSLCLALGACGDPGGGTTEVATDTSSDVAPDGSPDSAVEPPDHPGQDLVLTTLDGTVTLGAGYNVARVVNGFDDVAVSGTTFRIRTPEDDRQLAIALSAAGHPVALAWLGPGHATIDARSTAEVLAYIAIGAYHAPQDQHARLVALLDDAPELDELADGLSRLGFRHPDGFGGDELDYGLQAQLEDACEELLKTDRTARGMLIDPSDEQSGLRLDNLGSLDEVTFTNRFRRRAHVFIDRVGIFEDGIETVIDERVTDLPITPVTGLRDGVGTLKQIVVGAADPREFSANDDVAYVPKAFGPVPLTNVAGADRTRYRVAVVGPGDGAGAYAELRDHERIQQYETALEFLVRDYLVPFLTDVIAPTKVVLSSNDDNAMSNAIMDLLRNDPAIQDAVVFGKTAQGMQIILGVSAAFAKLPTGLFDKVVGVVVTRVYGAEAAAAKQAAIMGPLAQVLRVFGGVNVGLKLFDSGVIERDMALSNRGDVWDIVVSDANVRLDPVESTIPPGDFVTLTANVVDGGEDDVYEYRYQTTGKFGTLQSALQRGNDITSSVEFVTYDAREPGTEEVTVTVLLVQGSERVQIGRATATITVAGSGVRITPEAPEVAPFAEQTFTATLFGDDLPPDVTFRWSIDGAIGDFAGQTTVEADVTGTEHSVTFVAGFQPGVQDILVEVFVPGEGEPLARTRVPVRVLPLRVAIAPANASLGAGEEVALTATVTPAPPRGVLTYEWTMVGQGTIDGTTAVEHSGPEATDTVTYRAAAVASGCGQVVRLEVTYEDDGDFRELLPTSARVRVDCPVEATILAPRDVVDTNDTINVVCDTGDEDLAGLTYTWSVEVYGDTTASIEGTSRRATLRAGPEDGDVEVVCKVMRDAELVAEASKWMRIYEEPEPPCQEAFDYAFWNSQNYDIQMVVSGALGGRVTVDVFMPYWRQDYYSVHVFIARGTGEPTITGPEGPLPSNVKLGDTVYTDVQLDTGGAKVRVSGAFLSLSSRGSVHIEMDTLPLAPACESGPGSVPCCPYFTHDATMQQLVLTGPLVVANVSAGVGSGRIGGIAVGVLGSE